MGIPFFLRLFPKKSRPTVVLFSVILVHLPLGTLFIIGNLTPYIASYLHVVKHETVDPGALTWFSAFANIAIGILSPIGGLVEKRVGTRTVILIGCIFVTTGVASTYFSIRIGIAGAYLSYGLIFGAGIGLAYSPCLACALRWLPEKKGQASGFVVAGFGLSGFIFNFVATYFINPKNDVPDLLVDGTVYFSQKHILSRVPQVFLVLAACYACMQAVGLVFVCNPPEDGYEEISESELSNELSPREMIRTPSFYAIWTILFCNCCSLGFINNFYKLFGALFIKDDHFLGLIGSLASIANTCGRVFWGFIGDRCEYKTAISCISAFLAALFFTFEACQRGGKAMLCIWVLLTFFTFSGNFVLNPIAVLDFFGKKNFAANYGIVFTAGSVASVVLALLTTILMRYISYVGFFFLCGTLSSVAFFVGLLVFRPRRETRKVLNRSEIREYGSCVSA